MGFSAGLVDLDEGVNGVKVGARGGGSVEAEVDATGDRLSAWKLGERTWKDAKSPPGCGVVPSPVGLDGRTLTAEDADGGGGRGAGSFPPMGLLASMLARPLS